MNFILTAKCMCPSSCQKLQTLENIMGMIVLSSMYNFFFFHIHYTNCICCKYCKISDVLLCDRN